MCSRRSPWNGSRIVLRNWKEQAAIVARHTNKPICDRIDAVAPRNAMSRSQIDRLTGRIEALQAQRKPPEQRIFTVLVRNHMRTDEEIARFCAEHGVTDNDLLIAQVLVQKLPLVAFLGQRLGSVRDAPGRTCDPLVPKKGVRLATLNNQRFFARLTMIVRDWLRSSCGERRSLP